MRGKNEQWGLGKYTWIGFGRTQKALAIWQGGRDLGDVSLLLMPGVAQLSFDFPMA